MVRVVSQTSAEKPHEPSSPEQDEHPLSPSERMGVNAVNRISGNRRGRGSTQAALGSIALGFEIFAILLTGLTVFGLRRLDPPELGIWGGVGLTIISVIALATMRWKVGIWLGWLVQLLLLLTGIVLPPSLFVSVLFTALWVYVMIKGAKIDRQRAVWRAQGLIP
jgi:hypothetical protein